MSLLRATARPLIAGIFLYGGYDAFRNAETKVPRAEKVAPKLAAPLGLPDDTVQLVRLNAAVQLGAGTALALGWFPRLAALALAGSLVPTTVAGHPFWEETEPASKHLQRLQFFKNTAILGGLLLAAAG